MAVIHQATLRPTKLELLAAWLPERPWYTGRTGDVHQVAAYRFDDPVGAVGIETILVRADHGPVYQVPLTYRAGPMEGGDAWLIGTMEHSVLGKRWVYDAAGDPVYAAALAGAILANTGQAEQLVLVEGRLEPRELSMSVASTAPEGALAGNVPGVNRVERVEKGDPTRIVTDTVTLSVARRLSRDAELSGTVLTGTWPGRPESTPLASAERRD
ncbi:hypothetical protein K3N28_10490 [Glycomyces sp. TRM65418]|uniref:CG0192-related protein n=1 Tax=Glycomyces sp. TRM65418 TaxID=2867006 RepID=UPI001CE6BA5A|nr:hypothetical protein [Glycomyces sp. TRM65418]MCC3763502.1 hypothetical protein [Glycomyces sp. TRM65418]QZD57486.1 hypothetical protein K3N28_10430 [Glycomyces sp. TRM65418]